MRGGRPFFHNRPNDWSHIHYTDHFYHCGGWSNLVYDYSTMIEWQNWKVPYPNSGSPLAYDTFGTPTHQDDMHGHTGTWPSTYYYMNALDAFYVCNSYTIEWENYKAVGTVKLWHVNDQNPRTGYRSSTRRGVYVYIKKQWDTGLLGGQWKLIGPVGNATIHYNATIQPHVGDTDTYVSHGWFYKRGYISVPIDEYAYGIKIALATHGKHSWGFIDITDIRPDPPPPPHAPAPLPPPPHAPPPSAPPIQCNDVNTFCYDYYFYNSSTLTCTMYDTSGCNPSGCTVDDPQCYPPPYGYHIYKGHISKGGLMINPQFFITIVEAGVPSVVLKNRELGNPLINSLVDPWVNNYWFHMNQYGSIVLPDASSTCTNTNYNYTLQDAISNGCPRLRLNFNCVKIWQFKWVLPSHVNQNTNTDGEYTRMTDNFYIEYKTCGSNVYTLGSVSFATNGGQLTAPCSTGLFGGCQVKGLTSSSEGGYHMFTMFPYDMVSDIRITMKGPIQISMSEISFSEHWAMSGDFPPSPPFVPPRPSPPPPSPPSAPPL